MKSTKVVCWIGDKMKDDRCWCGSGLFYNECHKELDTEIEEYKKLKSGK